MKKITRQLGQIDPITILIALLLALSAGTCSIVP